MAVIVCLWEEWPPTDLCSAQHASLDGGGYGKSSNRDLQWAECMTCQGSGGCLGPSCCPSPRNQADPLPSALQVVSCPWVLPNELFSSWCSRASCARLAHPLSWPPPTPPILPTHPPSWPPPAPPPSPASRPVPGVQGRRTHTSPGRAGHRAGQAVLPAGPPGQLRPPGCPAWGVDHGHCRWARGCGSLRRAGQWLWGRPT